MTKVLLNAEELELIEAIRNVKRSYPNGYENLLWYAQQLFDQLVEMPQWTIDRLTPVTSGGGL